MMRTKLKPPSKGKSIFKTVGEEVITKRKRKE